MCNGFCICILLLAAYALTVTLNWPGHYSVDSIVQLAEGMTGYYFSFNPPLMAELLGVVSRFAGHGIFMAINASIFFVAIGLIWYRKVTGFKHLLLVGPVALFVALNPVTLIYNGTVWKDVFCANLLLLSFSIVYSSKNSKAIFFALLLAAMAAQVRQQGAIVSVIICCYAALQITAPAHRHFSPLSKNFLKCFTGWVLMGVALSFFVSSLQTEKVGNPGQGFLSAARFDIAGMIYFGDSPQSVLSQYVKDPVAAINAAKKEYSPERVDTLNTFPNALGTESNGQTYQLWWAMVRADPSSFIRHKRAAAQKLFGSRMQNQCLPVYLGVADETLDIFKRIEYPYAFPTGFLPTRSSHIPELWNYVQFGLAFYTGWLWLALLMTVLVVGLLMRNMFAVGLSLGGLLYSGSFMVIGLACDFRYQYFGVVASMLGMLAIFVDLISKISTADRLAEN